MFPSRSPLGDLGLLRRPFAKNGLLLVSFSAKRSPKKIFWQQSFFYVIYFQSNTKMECMVIAIVVVINISSPYLALLSKVKYSSDQYLWCGWVVVVWKNLHALQYHNPKWKSIQISPVVWVRGVVSLEESKCITLS